MARLPCISERVPMSSISPEKIRRFKALYVKYFGTEPTESEAEIELLKLVKFIKNLSEK